MIVKPAEETLEEALEAFDFPDPVAEAVRYGEGHINDTFRVSAGAIGHRRRFILQRISAEAFPRPDQLMENIVNVTEYCRHRIAESGGDPCRETLQVLRARSGGNSFADSLGGTWRLYPFIEGTVCYQMADSPALFAAAGRAFGRFQRMLGGYPAGTLHETIPRFHDTPDRFARFRQALAEDPLGRAGSCEAEAAFIAAREADCSVCVDALRRGVLPLRVTHNDAKLNNVLIDEATGEGVCVIDLDTVMPGLSVNDFGDSIRFGANHSAEDERDLGKVELDLDLVDIYARAFWEGCGGSLTTEEVGYLPWGAKLMTLECGIRFLTDYLRGDTYFHTERPGQNLDRCRTQLKLVADMERRWGEMEAIAASLLRRDG